MIFNLLYLTQKHTMTYLTFYRKLSIAFIHRTYRFHKIDMDFEIVASTLKLYLAQTLQLYLVLLIRFNLSRWTDIEPET